MTLFAELHPECNAYCRPTDGVHALVGWHDTATHSDPLNAAQRAFRRHFGATVTILEMRPAPEAVAPDDWREREQLDDKARRPAQAVSATEVAYLTIVQVQMQATPKRTRAAR